MKINVIKQEVKAKIRGMENIAPEYYRNKPFTLKLVNTLRLITFRKRYRIPLHWWTLEKQQSMVAINSIELEKELTKILSEKQ